MIRPLQLTIGLLVLASASPVTASYIPYRLFEMVGGAEVVVAGQITSLTETTYVLKLDRVVAGTHATETIEVRRFRDWPCAFRHAPYKVGQQVVACLVRDETLSRQLQRPIYCLMGAGCESEIPVVDDFAYLPDFSRGLLPRASLGRNFLDDEVKIPLPDLISAIEGHRALYRVTLGAKWDDRGYFTAKLERLPATQPSAGTPFRSRQPATSPRDRLRAYSQKSPLHQHLVDATEEAAHHLGLGSISWKQRPDDTTPAPIVIRYRAAAEPSPE